MHENNPVHKYTSFNKDQEVHKKSKNKQFYRVNWFL
jgi:hypothetical protein